MGKRALIAENNTVHLKMLREVFVELGYETDIACDEQAVFQALNSDKSIYYDLVTLDIRMPRTEKDRINFNDDDAHYSNDDEAGIRILKKWPYRKTAASIMVISNYVNESCSELHLQFKNLIAIINKIDDFETVTAKKTLEFEQGTEIVREEGIVLEDWGDSVWGRITSNNVEIEIDKNYYGLNGSYFQGQQFVLTTIRNKDSFSVENGRVVFFP